MKKLILVLSMLILLTSFSMSVFGQTTFKGTVTWDAVTNVTPVTYNVYRGTVSTGVGAVKLNTVGLSVLTYVDMSGVLGTTYYYAVSGVNADGIEGTKSTWISFMIPIPLAIPAAPTNVRITP